MRSQEYPVESKTRKEEQTMKAAVLTGVRSVMIEERPLPKVKTGEALVKVEAAGICGSNLHGFQGIWPEKRAAGLVMGHENTGTVVDVDRQVKAARVGDTIAIFGAGHISYSSKYPSFSPTGRALGFSQLLSIRMFLPSREDSSRASMTSST